MAELFDESHFFMCSGGLKPARMKSNQNITRTDKGDYYLTEKSLQCKGLDFSCRWVALLYAVLAAAFALLMSNPAGWVLLAAIAGAAAGALVGGALCADMASIAREWVVIKNDAKIETFQRVANRPGNHLTCTALFNETITYTPNIKSEFHAFAIFAGNIITTGLQAFMYVYAFRGAGLLFKAPMAFVRNFGVNYLASLTMKGVAMRSIFAGYGAFSSYSLSSTEGGDSEQMMDAALDGGLFIERAIYRVASGKHYDSEKGMDWRGLGDDVSLVLSMGGISGGKNNTDAQKGDIGNMGKQVITEWKNPAQTAKAEVGKMIETAKVFREQIRKLKDGKGAKEKPKVLSKHGKTAEQHAVEEMQKILDAGEMPPESLGVGVHKTTGDILIGKNRALKERGNVHETTKETFKEGSKEPWDELNCSEADLNDQIHRRGENPNDYEYHTVEYDKKTGEIRDKHTCNNCDVNAKEQIENGDVKSNTEESKSRRDQKTQERINQEKQQKADREKRIEEKRKQQEELAKEAKKRHEENKRKGAEAKKKNK